MSTLQVNAIQNTSGVEQYLAKAWVNFNGTGTVAIRASGNVSSITDNGTGDYTVNFTTALPDANYCIVASFKNTATLPTPAADFDQAINVYANSASTAYIYTGWRNELPSNGRIDPVQVHVAIFR